MIPGSPGSPVEQLPTPTVSGSLQAVQDAVSRAFQALVTKGIKKSLAFITTFTDNKFVRFLFIYLFGYLSIYLFQKTGFDI